MTEGSGGGSQPPDNSWPAPPPGSPGAARWQPAAPQPRAIPLRPLSLGEIFNGAITSMRRSPAASLGIAAALSAVAGITSALIALLIDHAQSAGSAPGPVAAFAAYVFNLIVGFSLNVLLYGLLAPVIGRNVQGMSTGLREAWRLARPRLPALLGTTMLLVLIYCALWIPFGLVLAVAVGTGQPVVILLAVLAGLVTVLAEVAGWVLLSMAASVVMLERTGPARALRRSWQLVRASFWRILGILLLTAVIYFIAYEIIALPFVGAELAIAGLGPQSHVSASSLALAAVGAVVAGAVTRPFLAGVTVLLYSDTRMRREGLDLVLRSGAAGPLSAADASLIWAPPGQGSARQGPARQGQPGRPAW